MQPIEINVKVTIGMENALLGIISKLIENREAAPAAVPAPKPRKQAKPAEEKPQVEVENKPEPTADSAEPQQEQPTTEMPAESAPTKQAAQKNEYTEVDVRAAMDKVRCRIEGENYKEQPDSEGYKRWHKELTNWFKNTAAFCGADKPSALPDSASRERFIRECEEVRIENNQLTIPLPF